MGGANRRGSYQQRKDQAIERNKINELKEIARLKAIEDAKSPEQKMKEQVQRIKAQKATATLLGMMGELYNQDPWNVPVKIKNYR